MLRRHRPKIDALITSRRHRSQNLPTPIWCRHLSQQDLDLALLIIWIRMRTTISIFIRMSMWRTRGSKTSSMTMMITRKGAGSSQHEIDRLKKSRVAKYCQLPEGEKGGWRRLQACKCQNRIKLHLLGRQWSTQEALVQLAYHQASKKALVRTEANSVFFQMIHNHHPPQKPAPLMSRCVHKERKQKRMLSQIFTIHLILATNRLKHAKRTYLKMLSMFMITSTKSLALMRATLSYLEEVLEVDQRRTFVASESLVHSFWCQHSNRFETLWKTRQAIIWSIWFKKGSIISRGLARYDHRPFLFTEWKTTWYRINIRATCMQSVMHRAQLSCQPTWTTMISILLRI